MRSARDGATPRAGIFERIRQRYSPRPPPAPGFGAGQQQAGGGGGGGGTPRLGGPAPAGSAAFNGPIAGAPGGVPHSPTLLSQCFGCEPADDVDPVSREIMTFFKRLRNFVRIAAPREHWIIWCTLNFYICSVVTFWMLEPWQTTKDRVLSLYLHSWGARSDQRIWCGRLPGWW